jgi:lipopolysaccharide export system ATP-binding protein
MECDVSRTRGLAVVSIAKSFGSRAALHDVSLRVDAGEVVALLGPDGAGKTVCFYSIIGLLYPDSGRIILDGQDITRLPMYRRALLGLGYLPEEPSVFRGLTVAQNVRSVLEIFELDETARAARLDALLRTFHIDHLRDARATSLSGGERRRCEIARAMAAEPTVMLLDEPFAGIDPLTIADVKSVIVELKHRDVGILVTDYNVHEIVEMVDRAYVLFDGRVIFEGSPEQLARDEAVRRVFLGRELAP